MATEQTNPHDDLHTPVDAAQPESIQVSGRAGFPVVALGASAGGLEAFERFFELVPSDSGMAFVVISHLSPAHRSMLGELLAKFTGMPVRQIDEDVRVQPNHVYVIRPGTTITIHDGVLRADSINPENGRRTPIDTFFRSLAEDQRDNAACILLSGTGTDGTLGLRAIKEFGGMAIAQAIETARYDSILRSAISTGLVDYILPIEEMPAKLAEYANHVNNHRKVGLTAPKQTFAQLLGTVHAILRRRTGHDFSHYKENTILRRMFRRIQVLQIESIEKYVELLAQDERESDLLFKDLLIGVTQFFRDPEAFEALAKEVIPKLFEEKGADDQIRVSVYGCSTGEEAYSLAIILREHMDQAGVSPRVQVFATDIDEEALSTARTGRYPSSTVENISPERLNRFFKNERDTYQINKEVRELCLFSSHSLIRDPPFSRMDLISCRNVLIYLGPEIQKRIIPLMHYALRRGGYLFLGPSETITAHRDLFKTVDKKHRIFQRKEQVARPRVDFPIDIPRQAAAGASLTGQRHADQQGLSRTLERLVAEKFAPASTIIDETGHAVYFSGRVGKYLEPQPGAPSHDVINMARDDLRMELRSSIHRAVKGNETIVRDDIQVRVDGGVQHIRLTVQPLKELGDEPRLYIVIFEELVYSESAAIREPNGETAAANGRVTQLEHELRAAREHLQTVVEELESSNEELRSSLEEFQSTNEELETSKEELQSLNEELETLNSELNRKITALDQANYDLQSLLEGTQIATVFLDRELRIKKYTPSLNTVFPLILGDVGRPITDIAQSFVGPIVFENAKEVIRTGEAQERELRTPDNRWYMMRVLPYQPEPGHAEGAVMTFVDVTGLKNAQEAARDAKLYSESIVEAARAPLVVLDAALRVRSANPSFYQLFELAPELTLGRPFFEIGKREWDILPLRESLTQVITKDAVISDFHVDADFERVGKRNLILNIRKLHVAGEAALLVTMEDITDRKRVEESLIRQARLARSNAAWEQFAYAASHDLREPLRMITSYTELLQQRLGDRLDQETRRFMTFVIEGANRMGTLITALLDFSRAGAEDSPSTVVDCNDSLREAISNLSEEIRQTGAVITHDPLPRVSVHPAPMLVILQNLLQNAVKYHAEDRNPEVHVSARQTENEWIFSVRDNGIGIDPHDFKRIFGLFKRLHGDMYPGTGIGLAVCQRLIERYGGGIWVESEVGRGSTFRFSLPLES